MSRFLADDVGRRVFFFGGTNSSFLNTGIIHRVFGRGKCVIRKDDPLTLNTEYLNFDINDVFFDNPARFRVGRYLLVSLDYYQIKIKLVNY